MFDLFKVFSGVSSDNKSEAIEVLIEHGAPRRDFFVMVILSVSMAVFGIYLDQIVIVIGSMLIAPVLYPILTAGLGIVIADISLVKRSFATLTKSVIYALVISFVIGFLIPLDPPKIEVLTGELSIILYALVAVFSGAAASLAMSKPDMNESFTGIAVSVSLVPPLAFVGVGIAELNLFIIQTYSTIFLVNVSGIIFSAVMVFSLMNFSSKRAVAEHEIEKTDKEIQAEKVE